MRVIDGRYAAFRIVPETRALDLANDVRALAHEGRVHLSRAYDAHVQSDWPRYLSATEAINTKLVAIGDVARAWAGVVEEAPALSEGQLSLALACPDGLAGPSHGRAA